MGSCYEGQANKRGIRKWVVEWIDHAGKRRTKTAFVDKASSLRLLEQFEAEAEQVRRGLLDPAQLRRAKAQREPLADLLTAYGRHLEAKSRTPKHVQGTLRLIEAAHDGLGWTTLGQVDVAAVSDRLNAWRTEKTKSGKPMRGRSAAAFNSRVTALKSFGNWLWRNNRTSDNLYAALEKLDSSRDRRYQRRAISEAELRRLIETTAAAPPIRFRCNGSRHELTGQARADLYVTAAATGLRRGELLALRHEMVVLGDRPALNLPASITKNRKASRLPIAPDVAAALARRLACTAPGEPLWLLPDKIIVRVFQPDLARANIEARDADGRVVDLHALRHAFATDLASHEPLSLAQKLCRHSTPTLTSNVYAHPEDGAMRGAVMRAAERRQRGPQVSHAAAAQVIGAGLDGGAFELVTTDHGAPARGPESAGTSPAESAAILENFWNTNGIGWCDCPIMSRGSADEQSVPTPREPLEFSAKTAETLRQRSLSANIPGAIRTHDLRIRRGKPFGPNSFTAQDLSNTPPGDSGELWSILAETWPHLSDQARQVIMAVVGLDISSQRGTTHEHDLHTAS